ncbi:HNH endonuclease [Acidocella facilis]|uniref:HNH endonuclease n=1 Tax=Acidocella facilis TaxID=525 RepID=UPI001F184C99|nr:HNH endonuclease [Acidocella facilis]
MTFSAEHVREAFRLIDENGIPDGFRQSTKWDIINPENDRRYPPKAVLHLAARCAGDPTPNQGGGWPTNDPLQKRGFQILLKEHLETDLSNSSNLIQDINDIAESNQLPTTKTALINARLGQGTFRSALLEIWDGKCAVTGCGVKEALRASHIKSWSLSNDKERLDPSNGILLTASLDALFDKHIITFSTEGKIWARSDLSADTLAKLGLYGGNSITCSDETQAYLDSHRQKFLEKYREWRELP